MTAITQAGPARRSGARSKRDPFRATPLTKVALGFTVLLSIFPIYWMVIIASRTNRDAVDVPPPLLPGGNLGENVQRVLNTEDAHFITGLVNSLIVTSTVTFSVVIISTFAGFAFARLHFRGRNLLLGSILITMMVPLQQMGIVPLYQLMVSLGWVGTLKAVILPYLLNGFGVFMMTQYTDQAVPDELVEAARVDGASTMRIWWNVILPAVRPGMAVLALQTFMLNWNEFMWPLIVLSPENPTVQVSISFLTAAHSTDYVLIFTGTALSVLPLVIVFVAFGRQIVGGLMEGAVKA
ncbi:sugar ABC transporter permease [Sphaerisporangium melleum]|uniref:Sugar ABC transporter permease n=1 Tax=Sphaerisporangium melleum TaxID=321316 RepID=A0A917R6V0_9ACTN|nr:carbohydrate ABC transporter permease [Sphaerisporangium melleum]GGK93236.1 sugar ABC transporter permease [Sphaerisporangium melleum]GII73434.1 sugar ABC transporter permease [Sphaerisporangium melleum]